MKCERCDNKAISSRPALCKEHFNEFILSTVEATIQKFSLFTKKTNILVAVSGGKDSLALADILGKLGYSVSGLFIDEGIKNYREHSKEDLALFSQIQNFTVLQKSFKEEFGFDLDEAIQTKLFHACTICGTLRRYLLNKYSRGFDCIATGHNLDDEAQTILMNLNRGNTNLFLRLGPKSKERDEFTQRVKPFYYLTEKQILTYTLINNIRVQYGECPYAFTSYRANLRDKLNREEDKEPGTKKNIIETYLAILKKIEKKQTLYEINTQADLTNNHHLKEKPLPKQALSLLQSSDAFFAPIRECLLCGEPSQKEICKTCQLTKEIRECINKKLNTK